MKNKILVYGALGYTGKLFAQFAKENHFPVILAARDAKLVDFAKTLDLEARIFALDKQAEIIRNLQDVKLLINLAGPFSKTNKPLIDACIASQTHYIDIAGEYPEFETVFQYNEQAKKAQVMLMPGAGFGIVPTDIAAYLVKQKLPDATSLIIAFATNGGASQGTLKTVLKDIDKAGVQRIKGNLEKLMPAKNEIFLKRNEKTYKLVANPWRADVFTAYHSTGIPNIVAYSNFPSFVISFMKGKMLWLRNFMLSYLVRYLPFGPSQKQLNSGSTIVWAIATNDLGKEEMVIIEGPEAYLFTIKTLLNISQNIFDDKFEAGFQTPAIYGKALIENIEKVQIK